MGSLDQLAPADPFTFLLLDVYELGDELLHLGDALLDGGLQRGHPAFLGPARRSVHVPHSLDSLAPNEREGSQHATRAAHSCVLRAKLGQLHSA